MHLKEITQGKTFEEIKALVTAPPYNLIIAEYEEFYLLKYSQIESDMGQPLCQECRGIILRKSDHKIVCHPFHKFFNHGEGHAAKIDWNTARVQEKIDGSLIKVWRHENDFRISSNGCIEATEAKIPNGNSLGDLFLFAAHNQELMWDKILPDHTYMFELISPYNKGVISYPKTAIYHIGTREHSTEQEKEIDLGIQKPREYSFNSFDDMLEASQKLPFSEEGYVVVDANYNRIKVKSPAYVAAHHLKNNGILTPKRFLAIVLDNEINEFISYFPEFEEKTTEAKEKLDAYIAQVQKDWEHIKSVKENLIKSSNKDFAQFREYRKEFAKEALKTTNSSIMFKLYDKEEVPDSLIEELVKSYDPEKLAEMIGLEV